MREKFRDFPLTVEEVRRLMKQEKAKRATWAMVGVVVISVLVGIIIWLAKKKDKDLDEHYEYIDDDFEEYDDDYEDFDDSIYDEEQVEYVKINDFMNDEEAEDEKEVEEAKEEVKEETKEEDSSEETTEENTEA